MSDDLLKTDGLPDEVSKQLTDGRSGLRSSGMPAKVIEIAGLLDRPFTVNEAMVALWNRFEIKANRKNLGSMLATHSRFERTTAKNEQPAYYKLKDTGEAPPAKTPAKGKGKGKTGGTGSRASGTRSGGRRSQAAAAK